MRRYGIAVALILAVCILTEGANLLGLLEPIDAVWYDIWHQIAGKRRTPERTAIAAIDDITLMEHPDEPLAFWSPHFAKAIEVLRKVGVSAIGIDFLFQVSAESWFNRFKLAGNDLSRTYDIPMREQLSLGKVILIGNVSKNSKGEDQPNLPVNDYLFSLAGNYADVGLANLYMDNDEVVRQFVPKILKDALISGLTLGALLAQRADSGSIDISSDMPRAIAFAGPPETIPRISFRKLLAPNAETDEEVKLLKNKVVIIGMENSGTADIHLTPYSRNFFLRSKRMMTGPEIHADIVETLLSRKYPRPIPKMIRFLWLLSVAILGTYGCFRTGSVRGLGWMLMLASLCTIISYFSFLTNRILPLADIHLALILCFTGSLGMRLNREEQARLRLHRILAPYVSDAVVKKIISGTKLPDLGGETLYVTVLFSDIRNFTTISEQLKPSEVVEILNHYYTLACEPILEGGGMVDKFIGDAIMAIFGAPSPYPDQTRQAVIAALKLKEVSEQFRTWIKSRFPDRNLPEFRIGVGMHSGEAVIGNIGSAKRMSYTAIGDTVNIASRLESMSKKTGWTIVASRAAADSAGSGIHIGRTEKVIPSGRTGEIEIVEILGLK